MCQRCFGCDVCLIFNFHDLESALETAQRIWFIAVWLKVAEEISGTNLRNRANLKHVPPELSQQNQNKTQTSYRVSLSLLSLCVCVHLMREIPFVLFHFQILVFLQTTVILSFLLIISVYFSCYILPLRFKFSSLYFLFLLLQTFFFTHSSSLCFSVWPNICLSLSPFNNFSLSHLSLFIFLIPFHSKSLGTALYSLSVSLQWLTFFPSNCLSARLRLYLSVHVCVWVYVCVGMCLCVKQQQSVILRKPLCLYSRHRRSTFYILTGLFALPPDFISCIICILLAFTF